MRKIQGLVGTLLFLAGPVFAADLPTKVVQSSATTASIPNWTGFYVDGGFGYGMWSADTVVIDPRTGACVLCVAQRQGGRGSLGTVGIGYDFQFTLANFNLVAGPLGSFDFTSIKGTIQDQINGQISGEEKMTSAWSAGVRLGWLVNPSVLTYFNGGWSRAHFDGTTLVSDTTGIPNGSITPSFSPSGWFIGSGVEYMFAPGWFARAEYRYAEYRSTLLPEVNPTPGITLNDISFRPIVQSTRTELVYKFNWSK
jgi:outer membrane immunogenic protein